MIRVNLGRKFDAEVFDIFTVTSTSNVYIRNKLYDDAWNFLEKILNLQSTNA